MSEATVSFTDLIQGVQDEVILMGISTVIMRQDHVSLGVARARLQELRATAPRDYRALVVQHRVAVRAAIDQFGGVQMASRGHR